jgi:N-glycosylase/DNA lyase
MKKAGAHGLSPSGQQPESVMSLNWSDTPRQQLNIADTLASGQCFRWEQTAEGEWIGVIEDSLIRLKPEEAGFWWETYPVTGRWELIHRYFALDVDLEGLYAEWRQSDPRIVPSLRRRAGLRILRQDAEEAFFAFHCATCNTVVKITRSVRALAQRYGEPICEWKGKTFYRFPSAVRLANASEAALREDLWGFRAPRMIASAQHLLKQKPGWLESLREIPYREAHAELVRREGIGAKVADCICLFALWHDEATPIDTHLWKIAVKMYRPDLRGRSLTPSLYQSIAELFRERYGAFAGWAQQYLFMDALNAGKPYTS